MLLGYEGETHLSSAVAGYWERKGDMSGIYVKTEKLSHCHFSIIM